MTRKTTQKMRKRSHKLRSALLLAVLLLVAAAALMKLPALHTAFRSWRLAAAGYPDSLISLLERNPETEDFVLDYPEQKNTHAEVDLSGEVVQGEIPLFLQWDERWGYETYGDDFLAVTGCGPTCLSMVVCGLTGEGRWNPYAVADWAEEQGYYVDGVGSSWELMDQGAQFLGLTVVDVSYDADGILAALGEGTPVICSMGPGDFTSFGHFIVLTGADDDGNVTVNDPNSRKNSQKTWDIDTLVPQMRNLWGYCL
ncbi:MAG: C39 family peptidase [Clostridiales bacterium]|nr:C39 family peptidase [Clostridiales bacterium]